MMVDNKVAYLIPLSAQKAMPAKRRLSTAVGSTTEDSKMSDGNSPGGSNAGSERGRSATPEPGRKRKKIDVVSPNNGNKMEIFLKDHHTSEKWNNISTNIFNPMSINTS